MRVSKLCLFCIVAMALSIGSSAEVYESKDAEGNTVFSDMPSQGAAEVKVPPTNSAEPVAITPRPTPSSETPAKPRKRPANSQDEERDDDYLYYGGDYDGDELNDETRRERRREDGETQPITDRPKVEHHRNTARPAGGGGGGRR